MAMKIISPKFFGEQLSLGAFRDVSNVDLLSLTRIPVPLLKRFCNCKGILFPLDSKEEREQRAGVAAGEGVDQSAETEKAGNGLTGEEILGVMERHPVLADVVNAVVVADTTPSDELHTKSAGNRSSRSTEKCKAEPPGHLQRRWPVMDSPGHQPSSAEERCKSRTSSCW